MHSLSHAGFLATAVATHALVGYTLGAVAFDAPRAGLAGAVFADVDLLVPATVGAPFVHRSLTHSVLAGVVVAALATKWGRRSAGAVALGYASQLLVDALTPRGIPVAYPISSASYGLALGGHSRLATALCWIGCLAVLGYRRASAS